MAREAREQLRSILRYALRGDVGHTWCSKRGECSTVRGLEELCHCRRQGVGVLWKGEIRLSRSKDEIGGKYWGEKEWEVFCGVEKVEVEGLI